MNKEALTDDQKQKFKEELIDNFIAFWIKDNDYIDLMFNKLAALISGKDDYRFFDLDDILLEALGGNLDDKDALLSNYLYSGKIKDWVKIFKEIHKHLEGKFDSNDSSLVNYIIESDELLIDAVLGLARSLSNEKIIQDVQEKLIPLLQCFHWKTNDFPKFYLYLVICHGIIGSKKSLPFLRSIIEESDIFSDSFSNDGYGEHSNDHFQDVRSLAIKDFRKISEKNELHYLFDRFKKECSFKVKQVLLFEIKKFNLPQKLADEIKSTKRYNDLIYNNAYDKKFLGSSFDDVFKQFFY